MSLPRCFNYQCFIQQQDHHTPPPSSTPYLPECPGSGSPQRRGFHLTTARTSPGKHLKLASFCERSGCNLIPGGGSSQIPETRGGPHHGEVELTLNWFSELIARFDRSDEHLKVQRGGKDCARQEEDTRWARKHLLPRRGGQGPMKLHYPDG